MSEIFNEINMVQAMEKYIPQGETLLAGIHAVAKETEATSIFGNCICIEDRLIPSENENAVILSKKKYSAYDIYFGITQSHFIIADCEHCDYLYQISDLTEIDAAKVQNITSDLLLSLIHILFWPLLEPHGKSVAGILTLSNYDISTGLRRSLPIQTDFAKLIDLDRCYTVSRVPTENGKELLLYNVHLSAYTTDPTIADKQLDMLYEDMAGEYQKGNYILCGGDFNKDLLGDSSQVFGISGEDYSWAQSFPFDTVPEGFSLVAPFDQAIPVPSCRNADAPWDPETNFQLTVDGFIVSDNIKVSESLVIDTDFKYSDHNPVQITFTLIS